MIGVPTMFTEKGRKARNLKYLPWNREKAEQMVRDDIANGEVREEDFERMVEATLRWLDQR